jgi:tRNA(fMet)-specific endonuclease VapC
MPCDGYLLDTSRIIDALNGRRERKAHLSHLLAAGHTLACCTINVIEVYAGMRPKERKATESFLQNLEYFEVTWKIAERAGRLRYDWARKGHTLSLPDVTIAAVAIENGLILLTDNARHFPMPELRLEKVTDGGWPARCAD